MNPNPHDALVRYTFGDVTHARGLLQSLVPRAVAPHIDWASLALEDGSFIDPQLAERQTDLLYRARIDGRDAFVYLLLEHQSSADRFMALRMLVYLTRIWDRLRREEPTLRTLPVIVPLVLHHSDRGWSAPTSLADLINADGTLRGALGPLLPQLSFHLTDLTKQDDQVLHAWLTTDLGKLVALCLKHAPYDAALDQRLLEWLDLFGKIVRSGGGVAGLDVIGRYLLEVNDISSEHLRRVLEPALAPKALEAIMTGADKLREQGRVEGLREGEERGRAAGLVEARAEVLLKQLRLKFGELPEAAQQRIATANQQQLDLWAERVLSATALAEVIAN